MVILHSNGTGARTSRVRQVGSVFRSRSRTYRDDAWHERASIKELSEPGLPPATVIGVSTEESPLVVTVVVMAVLVSVSTFVPAAAGHVPGGSFDDLV
jgi:hypothetical protein